MQAPICPIKGMMICWSATVQYRTLLGISPRAPHEAKIKKTRRNPEALVMSVDTCLARLMQVVVDRGRGKKNHASQKRLSELLARWVTFPRSVAAA